MKASTPLTDTNLIALTNTKYQKAIKQINKLISINTSVKKQLITLQQKYDTLKENFTQLQWKYSALVAESNEVAQNQKTIGKSNKNVQYYDESTSQGNIQININQSEVNSSQRRNKQNFSPLSVPNKELENTGTISQYIDNKRKMEELEQKLTEKQERIQTMIKKLAEKNRENTELYDKLNNQQKNQKQIMGRIQQLQQQKENLEKQLKKTEQIIAKLTNDYGALKMKVDNGNKLGFSEQMGVTNVKSLNIIPMSNQLTQNLTKLPHSLNIYAKNKPFFFNPTISTGQQNAAQKIQKFEPLSQFSLKKIKDLEVEIIKIKKQHSEKKSKYKAQISKLKQEIAAKDLKINQINSFIAKQQNFIEEYMIKNSLEQPKGKTQRSSKMISYPQDNEKNKDQVKIHNISLNQQEEQDNQIRQQTREYHLGGPHRGHYRINTTQSQEYTVPQGPLSPTNFLFNNSNKHTFIEGIKYYKK